MTHHMAEPSAVLITLAARLHTIRQQDVLHPDDCNDRKRLLARQTLEVLVPLAERLGANWLKGQLQDECFRYLHPKEYFELHEVLPRYVTIYCLFGRLKLKWLVYTIDTYHVLMFVLLYII